MNKILIPFLMLLTITINSCTNSQTSGSNLSAIDFNKKMEELTEEQIIDVRTPEEFAEGHIKNAVNIDWNNSNFESKISKIDKTKPVLIYCLGGGRSASAASKMKTLGFSQIFELNGGMMSWRNSNLPETKDSNIQPKSEGMTKVEFEKMIQSDKKVLVDFYAEWCGPCKKMKPSLDELSVELKETVTIIRIDVDKNPLLAKELKIEGLPTIHAYNKSELVWSNLGFMTKEEMKTKLQQ
jgi:thioredoxin 1